MLHQFDMIFETQVLPQRDGILRNRLSKELLKANRTELCYVGIKRFPVRIVTTAEKL